METSPPSSEPKVPVAVLLPRDLDGAQGSQQLRGCSAGRADPGAGGCVSWHSEAADSVFFAVCSSHQAAHSKTWSTVSVFRYFNFFKNKEIPEHPLLTQRGSWQVCSSVSTTTATLRWTSTSIPCWPWLSLLEPSAPSWRCSSETTSSWRPSGPAPSSSRALGSGRSVCRRRSPPSRGLCTQEGKRRGGLRCPLRHVSWG